MKCEHSPEIPEWAVSLTSPSGETGITIYMCHPCLLDLLHSPAVRNGGRTVHVRRWASRKDLA